MKKNNRTIFALVVLSTLALSALACGASTTGTPTTVLENTPVIQEEPAANEPGLSEAVAIESFKIFRDNGSGEPGEEVDSFLPTDHVQHFEAETAEMLSSGSVVKWVFTAVDTTAGADLPITEVETTVLVANTLNAQLSLEEDFPVGTYSADIYVDNVLIDSFQYTVEE